MAQAYNVDTNTFEDSSSFSKNKIKQQDYKVYLYKPLKLGPLNIIQFLACHFGVLLFLFVLFKLSFITGNMSGVIPLLTCLVCFGAGIVFGIATIFFEVVYICIFFKQLFNIVKLPLMKMNVKQAKSLKRTMKNFEIGGISISKYSYGSEDYFGVSDFYGYMLDGFIGFKPNFLGFLYLYCYDNSTVFLEFITRPFVGKIIVDKEYKQKFKESKINNSKWAIASLTKEVEKLQKQTNQYVQQAVDELGKVG